MRFLVCGLGSIGRRHLRNLVQLGYQDIVLYRTGKSTLPEDELKAFPTEGDLAQALERWRPDAVLIANPTAYHLDIAIPAAEQGCHLLIEKPISHSLERVDQLEEALTRGGGKVLTGFQFRFNVGLRKVAELLSTGRIGETVSIQAKWGEYLPDWHPWEDYRTAYSARSDLGGGVILTLCHPFDYVRWLFGEVNKVTAMMTSTESLGIEVESTAEISLLFESGLLGGVHLNYLQRPSQHWLEVIGTEGTLRWDSMDSSVQCWKAGAEDSEKFSAPVDYERNSMFLEEMRHFIQVISGEVEPVCSLEDGVEALRIAVAAKTSALESRLVSISSVKVYS